MADKRKFHFETDEDEYTPKKQRVNQQQQTVDDEEPLTPANQRTSAALHAISPARQCLSKPKDFKIINDGLYGHIRYVELHALFFFLI